MRNFDEEILGLLSSELGSEPIFYVGLGAFDFQFAFGNLARVQNQLRVDFSLRSIEYTWENSPSEVPAWLLINQIPIRVALEKPTALLMEFASGDWIRFHTEECAYECQVFEWAAATHSACARPPIQSQRNGPGRSSNSCRTSACSKARARRIAGGQTQRCPTDLGMHARSDGF